MQRAICIHLMVIKGLVFCVNFGMFSSSSSWCFLREKRRQTKYGSPPHNTAGMMIKWKEMRCWRAYGKMLITWKMIWLWMMISLIQSASLSLLILGTILPPIFFGSGLCSKWSDTLILTQSSVWSTHLNSIHNIILLLLFPSYHPAIIMIKIRVKIWQVIWSFVMLFSQLSGSWCNCLLDSLTLTHLFTSSPREEGSGNRIPPPLIIWHVDMRRWSTNSELDGSVTIGTASGSSGAVRWRMSESGSLSLFVSPLFRNRQTVRQHKECYVIVPHFFPLIPTSDDGPGLGLLGQVPCPDSRHHPLYPFIYYFPSNRRGRRRQQKRS